MTAEEAIRLLNPETSEAIEEIEYYGGFRCRTAALHAIKEATIIACEALEKQIPKKPEMSGYSREKVGNVTHFIYETYDCPNCHTSHEIECEKYDYCPDCGQALDWSEDND